MPEPIEANRVRELVGEGAQLVEVLPPEEYAEEHLVGAISIPLKTLDARTSAALDKGRPVIVYCWDSIWDLSPRAACRLDTLGFEHVFDYVAGKVDWLARGLPTEGEHASVPRTKDLVKSDAVTCSLAEPVGPVRERVEQSPYPFALVVSETGIVLGRLRRSTLDCPPDLPAEQLMEAGPSTVRPDIKLEDLVERLRKRDFHYAVVTEPTGRLIGVVRRSEAEARVERERGRA
jgi:rhodanese-related sulfurtransferase/CBS domain-containing protein